MAVTASTKLLTFPGKLIGRKLEKQNGDMLHMGSCFCDKRRLSLISASAQSDVGITVNGKKVNGKHVAGEAITAGKLANDENAALVTSLHGRFVESKFVYRQIFVIRSYEIGPDQTATMETLMNFLQVNYIINDDII